MPHKDYGYDDDKITELIVQCEQGLISKCGLVYAVMCLVGEPVSTTWLSDRLGISPTAIRAHIQDLKEMELI
jgi:DNA-binding transcriptional regulator GbsR (MarR family)